MKPLEVVVLREVEFLDGEAVPLLLGRVSTYVQDVHVLQHVAVRAIGPKGVPLIPAWKQPGTVRVHAVASGSIESRHRRGAWPRDAIVGVDSHPRHGGQQHWRGARPRAQAHRRGYEPKNATSLAGGQRHAYAVNPTMRFMQQTTMRCAWECMRGRRVRAGRSMLKNEGNRHVCKAVNPTMQKPCHTNGSARKDRQGRAGSTC